MKQKRLTALAALLIGAVLAVSSCTTNPTTAQGSADAQPANARAPEIHLGFGSDAQVTSLSSRHEATAEALGALQNLVGKPVDAALESVVTAVHQTGYIVGDMRVEADRLVIEVTDSANRDDDHYASDLSSLLMRTVRSIRTSQQTQSLPTVSQTRATSMPVDTTARSDADDAHLSIERVKAIALDHAGVLAADARFTEQELERSRGTVYYELEFHVGNIQYEYEIHVATGEILKHERQSRQPSETTTLTTSAQPSTTGTQSTTAAPTQPTTAAPPAPTTTVATTPAATTTTAPKPTQPVMLTTEQAMNIALQHAGVHQADVRYKKVELDHDDGVRYYEIEFKTRHYEYEFEIHAYTGKILKYEHDDDDDWDDDGYDDDDWDDDDYDDDDDWDDDDYDDDDDDDDD